MVIWPKNLFFPSASVVKLDRYCLNLNTDHGVTLKEELLTFRVAAHPLVRRVLNPTIGTITRVVIIESDQQLAATRTASVWHYASSILMIGTRATPFWLFDSHKSPRI
jgi:hypothetical protein